MATSPNRRSRLLPQDHLAAIGSVAVLWTTVESIMETVILGLYEIDLGRGLVLTSNLTFHSRISLLRILTKEGAITDAALAAEMATFFPRLDSAFGERNAVVHGLWSPAARTGYVKRLSIRARGKELRYTAQDYSAAELWAIADSIGKLLADFSDFGNRIGIPERLDAAPKHSSASK